MTPWVLAVAGIVFMLGALPWHLRARGVRGTWAIKPWWLLALGVAFLAAAFVSAAAGGEAHPSP